MRTEWVRGCLAVGILVVMDLCCSLPVMDTTFYTWGGPWQCSGWDTLTARGQSATFQWLHTPTGRAGIPAWGVGVGQGGRQGENCSAEADSATVPITLRPRSRGGKGNRSPTAPSRVGKKKPLNLPGLARGRSSRNCKMQSENIRSWASVP